MAENMKGLAVRWGVDGITFTAGIVTTNSDQQVQSVGLTRTADSQEIRNAIGEVVGKVFYNDRREVSISVIPSHASTVAGARASIAAHVIQPGTTITVLDSEGSELDAVFSGAYNLISSKMGMTNTGVLVVDLELEQFTDHNVTVAVT